MATLVAFGELTRADAAKQHSTVAHLFLFSAHEIFLPEDGILNPPTAKKLETSWTLRCISAQDTFPGPGAPL
jgi:hypothetical protein